MKVMIVDDSPQIRKLLKLIIADDNSFSECSNGEEAVRSYSSIMPDWVLMDIDMPVMNGLEASEKIINEYPGAKILMVTQHDEYELLEKTRTVGIKGFVKKENLCEVTDYLSQECIDNK